MKLIKNIAFFGYSGVDKDSPLYKKAYTVAKKLANAGYTIVNGGGPGVMDASTKGAEAVDGDTVAITFYPENAPGFEGRYVKNITDKEIKTGNYIERMFKLMEEGDIYIIFNGGTGTLSEFATAWCMARLYYGAHKPFILYGSFWKNIIDVISENMHLRGNEEDLYRIVETPEEVLEAVKEFEKDFQKRAKKFEQEVKYRGPNYTNSVKN
jgi:hypothetical protein